MVLPEFDAGVVSNDKQESAFRCADDVASLGGDLICLSWSSIDDCVFDSFFEDNEGEWGTHI